MIRGTPAPAAAAGARVLPDVRLQLPISDADGLVPGEQMARYGREQAQAVAIARRSPSASGNRRGTRRSGEQRGGLRPDPARRRQRGGGPAEPRLTVDFKSGWRVGVVPLSGLKGSRPEAPGSPVTECRQVTTTLPDREAAQRLGTRLVEERLAACAQVVGPVSSVYWWQGEVETAARVVLPSEDHGGAGAGPDQPASASCTPTRPRRSSRVPVDRGDAALLRWVEESRGVSPPERGPSMTSRARLVPVWRSSPSSPSWYTRRSRSSASSAPSRWTSRASSAAPRPPAPPRNRRPSRPRPRPAALWCRGWTRASPAPAGRRPPASAGRSERPVTGTPISPPARLCWSPASWSRRR